MERRGTALERGIERVLWASRFVVLVPVVFSLLMALVAFLVATVDAISAFGYLGSYIGNASDAQRAANRTKIVTTVIKSVDVYLLAIILLIVALGLYELFIGKIEAAENDPVAPRVLLIRSLDDLKNRLAKVIVLVLVVEFMQQALKLTLAGPLDLLYLAGGIALVGVGLWFSHQLVGDHD